MIHCEKRRMRPREHDNKQIVMITKTYKGIFFPGSDALCDPNNSLWNLYVLRKWIKLHVIVGTAKTTIFIAAHADQQRDR